MMNRVAIVTGAARGIGREIAQTLLNNGYHVALLDVDKTTLLSFKHDKDDSSVLTLPCDVGDENEVKSAIQEILIHFGRVDLVVNNAADIVFRAIDDLDYNVWRRVMDTNLGAIFLFAKYLKEELKKNRGSIINIASTRAYMSEPNTESYSASKGGAIALTHALAASLAPDVRVNSISPGWIDSRDEEIRQKEPLSQEDHLQHPAGRVGLPSDIASMVLWLADEQNSFVTGHDFVIDGGMTKKMIYR